MNPANYSVFVAWSDADQAYVANVFELPGCMAHGETRAEAVAQIEIAIENWSDTANELGRTIPEPRHLESYEKEVDAKTEQSAQEFEAYWKKIFTDALPAITPTIVEQLAEYFSRTSRYVSVVRDEHGAFKILFDEPSGARYFIPRAGSSSAEEHKNEARK